MVDSTSIPKTNDRGATKINQSSEIRCEIKGKLLSRNWEVLWSKFCKV